MNDLTPQERQFLLQMLNNSPVRGFDSAQVLLAIAAKLQRSLAEQQQPEPRPPLEVVN